MYAEQTRYAHYIYARELLAETTRWSAHTEERRNKAERYTSEREVKICELSLAGLRHDHDISSEDRVYLIFGKQA